ATRFACVPLPAPGGPRKITARFSDICRTAAPTALTATTPDSALPHEAVVIPHHELRFKLLHGIHRHANHNQQRRAAEIKLYVESVQHEPPHMLVEPVADEWQVLQVNPRNHPLRQQANDCQVHPANK